LPKVEIVDEVPFTPEVRSSQNCTVEEIDTWSSTPEVEPKYHSRFSNYPEDRAFKVTKEENKAEEERLKDKKHKKNRPHQNVEVESIKPENRIEKESNQIKEKNINSPQLSKKKTPEINEPKQPRNETKGNEIVESEPKLNKSNGFQPTKFNREELKRYMEEMKLKVQQEQQAKGVAKQEVEEKKETTSEVPNKTEVIVEVSKDISETKQEPQDKTIDNKKELQRKRELLEAQLRDINAQLSEN